MQPPTDRRRCHSRHRVDRLCLAHTARRGIPQRLALDLPQQRPHLLYRIAERVADGGQRLCGALGRIADGHHPRMGQGGLDQAVK